MAKAVVALGSNIPPRRRHLSEACSGVASLEGCRILDRSFVYETEPVGGPPQAMYLNAALVLETARAPQDMLDALLRIETEMGRVRCARNAPRIIDLDIIFYDEITLKAPGIEIPHPRFRERGFVLLPLKDIIPGFPDPITGKTVVELLEGWRKTGGENCKRLERL
jgi:2-amino-4-hydroxy-6-hydroxymethyldihydropteridine diphosphokinase